MAYFRAKLRFEIDVMDVADAPEGTIRAGGHSAAIVLGTWAYPGCSTSTDCRHPVLCPRADSSWSDVVVYSWGPGCNGSTVAALAFAELGYPVREMIGGIEYWARNGLPVETVAGVAAGKPDSLVTAHPD